MNFIKALHYAIFMAVAVASFQMLAEASLIKGISYGPMPCKGPCEISQDDFMSQAAKPMWGRRGRGDLQIMKQLGANAVRLYGNNPENTHWDFLDEAQDLGLSVIPGISDWEFIQSEKNCLTTNFDCYSQIKESYLGNLKRGFLQSDGTYHPALKQVVIINEPDLKLPSIDEPKNFSKAIITSIDAILDAEKEMNVHGALVNLTVAFSFGVCTACPKYQTKPALGQMVALHAAMMDPTSVGYTARNDLAEFYRTRFVNSFNTANPAKHIQEMFLDDYEIEFPTTSVMIQEYHCPWNKDAIKKDVKEVLKLAESHPLLLGVSFFEFSVRYDKGGSEMDFGMFDFGDFSVADFDYFGDDFNAWCLIPAKTKKGNEEIPSGLAKAYGGKALDYHLLCVPDPDKVPLTAKGFNSISRQADLSRMKRFMERMVEHHAGNVVDSITFGKVAASYISKPTVEDEAGRTATGASNFSSLAALLSQKPDWASWNHSASCIADRDSHAVAVGAAVGIACGGLQKFDCDHIPPECKESVWDVADYAFGALYAENPTRSALETCYYSGAATLAGNPDRLAESKPACVIPVRLDGTRRLEGFDIQKGPFKIMEMESGDESLDSEEDEAQGSLPAALLATFAALIAMSVTAYMLMPRLAGKRQREVHSLLQVNTDKAAAPVECISVEVVECRASSSSLASSLRDDDDEQS